MSGNRTIVVIGPGPVTLGQGSCFQYTAARACRLMRRMGKRVLVLEDNPATLMDMEGGEEDLYMEPPAPEVVECIVKRSGAGSVLYGLGGRRGWSLALRLAGEGWYKRFGLAETGNEERIMWLCGDRSLLRETLESSGFGNPSFQAVADLHEGHKAAEALGLPLVIRPHFSSGGWGSFMAYNLEEYPLLLEEALRESLNGEVLVEEALEGWHKYIAISLRDGTGGFQLCGIVEQVDYIPRHDQDAILLYPACGVGDEEVYGITEMVREVSEALGLMGLAEVKLAVQPGWESVYVMDVNPWPWRTMPLLETAQGRDLLSVHINLIMGGSLGGEGEKMHSGDMESAVVAVPRMAGIRDAQENGRMILGCRSLGRKLFTGKDTCEATEKALKGLSGWDKGIGGANDISKALRRLVGGFEDFGSGEGHTVLEVSAGGGGPDDAICMSRSAEGDVKEGAIFLAGDDDVPGGGYEDEVNCIQALAAWRRTGGKAILFTENPCMALMAASQADAVYMGPMMVPAVTTAASETGAGSVVAHFGGSRARACARALASRGFQVWELDSLREADRPAITLGKLKDAGLRVVEFACSDDLEGGQRELDGFMYPVLAAVTRRDHEEDRRLLYSREDAQEYAAKHDGKRILWREIREEWQEIEVEAVVLEQGDPLMLVWEQLDEVGISSSDGLAMYPPCYLTTGQSEEVGKTAGRILETLLWKGNISMRMLLNNGDIHIWDIKPVPSSHLPFLHRASGIPLAELGVLSLGGVKAEYESTEATCGVVRNAVIPYGAIASSEDILPSPRRRSTGSVLGIASSTSTALAKALWSEGMRPQPGGKAFLSVANREKRRAVLLARELLAAGYVLTATRGTAHTLGTAGIKVETIYKLREGRPNVSDHIRNGDIRLVVNIPRGKTPHSDGFYIRAASARHGVPCITNMEVALALARGMRNAEPERWEVRPWGEYYRLRDGVGGM
ncbi:MAG: ATP-grasp domain-containing protein [Actinomycetota bacterium]|nr:ATP-grasp domain-containing protein [Actinomycetota bacterium]